MKILIDVMKILFSNLGNVGQQQLVYSTQGFTSTFPSSRLILNPGDPSSISINNQQNWQQVILSPFPTQQQTSLPVQQTLQQQIQLQQHQPQNVHLQMQPLHHQVALQHQQIQFQPHLQQQQQISPRHPVQVQIQAPQQIQIQPHPQGSTISNHHLQHLQPSQLHQPIQVHHPNQQIVIQSQPIQHSQTGETLILPQGTFINNPNGLTMTTDSTRMKFHQVFSNDNLQSSVQYTLPTTQTVNTLKTVTTPIFQPVQYQPTFTVAYPTTSSHQSNTGVTMVPMSVSTAPLILRQTISTEASGSFQTQVVGAGIKYGKSSIQKKSVEVSVLPKGSQRVEAKTEKSEKVPVPWSWNRIINVEGNIIYLR